MDVFEFIAQDRFAAEAGCKLVSCGEREAVVEVELEARHLNAVGTAQGGLVFTLADTAFAAVANFGGGEAVALSSTINYLRPAAAGKLTARAALVSRTRSTCCVVVAVTDGDGRDVARLQCAGYYREKKA